MFEKLNELEARDDEKSAQVGIGGEMAPFDAVTPAKNPPFVVTER